MNITGLCAHWVALHDSLGVGTPIMDEAHYKQALDVIEPLMEAAAKDTSGALYGLVNLMSDRIRDYEDSTHPWPNTTPSKDILRFLMQFQ